MNALEKLKGKLIVSAQAEVGEPFYPKDRMLAMVESVLLGGAAGLRMAGESHIKYVKAFYPNVPMMGITKPKKIPANYKERVYITPTLADVAEIANAGAQLVALDATHRPRPNGETLEGIVAESKKRWKNLLLVADIATEEDGLRAEQLGFDAVSTTLNGYTVETAGECDGPNLTLVANLAKKLRIPVIAEGRISTPGQLKEALACGAHAVVVGSAITRPHLVTAGFVRQV